MSNISPQPQHTEQPRHTEDSLRNWIADWLARELQVPRADIAPDENLLTYGMDSVSAVMLVGDLEDHLGLRLTPTLVWDYPTARKLGDKAWLEYGNELSVSPSPGTNGRLIESMDIAEAKQLLERLDELSDTEVETLLARLSREE